MFMVCILHCCNSGGVLNSLNDNSIKYYLVYYINICAYCAVNCYALISGFVGYNNTFKYKRIINIWLTAFFILLD